MSVRASAENALARGKLLAKEGAGAVLGSVVSVRTTAPQVVLTFDDGPEPSGTDRVLEALAQAGASATFFMLLGRVRRFPTLARDVVAAGHEVALHGLDHRAVPTLPPAEVAGLLRGGRAELEDTLGQSVRWYRPPYGRQTMRNWRAAVGAGLMPVLWGPTTLDWTEASQDERLAAAQRELTRGAVVLAHDGFAGPEDGACDGPPPSLDRGCLVTAVLEAYQAQGLTARSLGTVLGDGGRVVRLPWFPG